MPTITIDGQQVTVDEGTTVIRAAEKIGIQIPHYCYHPGLSLAGSCRLCMVEVENMPALQISCYTRVQDGMKVTTTSERVLKTRQAMLEFLLSNHPLDCPVCDQSGECDLQNYYMKHGLYDSRFLEDKIKKKKAFPIGPHVMLDQERCILCTRCVRFTDEVSKSNELGVFNRGNRSVIDLNPGSQLDNPYSGNVIDICPVGALTESDFRFRCRVWYLSTEDSICNGCSRGCNISIHHNPGRRYKAGGHRVMRIKPRYNPEVNRWWICDAGRFGYSFIDENRIEYPHIRRTNGPETAEWKEVLDATASAIRQVLEEKGAESVGVIVSPQLSNEELFLCKSLFVEGLGLTNVALDNPWEQPGEEDDFLIKSDKNPNRRGARELGFGDDAKELLERAASGNIKVLYIFWHDFNDPEAVALLERVETLVFQGVNWNSTAQMSTIVLAGSTHAEKDGTFTNFQGRVQRFKQAFLPLEDARDDSLILRQLAEELGHPFSFPTDEAFFQWKGVPLEELGDFGSMPPDSTALQG